MSKPYRPSNSTEGEIFMQSYCYKCVKYDERDGCPIINDSMALDINDAGYPRQLQLHNESSWCTEFVHENGNLAPGVSYLDQPDPTAAARAEAQTAAGQMELFELPANADDLVITTVNADGVAVTRYPDGRVNISIKDDA